MYIEKKSTAEIPEVHGAVVDTRNITDKTTNAYSARIIDEMNIYSTEEIFTGKYWINGKPIYRKVIDLGGIPATAIIKKVDLNIPNLDMITDFNGIAYRPDTKAYMHLPQVNNETGQTGLSVGVSATEQKVIMYSGVTNFSTYTQAYLTLEYTKTTD